MNQEAETLKSSERRSPSWDFRNAPINYLSLLITQFGSIFFSFASIWLINKTIGTEGYGKIIILLAASQVLQIFVNWTTVALARYSVGEFVDSGKITKSFWSRTFILLPNIFIILTLSFFQISAVADWLQIPVNAVWYIVGHFIAQVFWIHIQQCLQGAKLLRLLGILLMTERGIIFLFLIFFSLSKNPNYTWAILPYVISPLLVTIIGLFGLRGIVSYRPQYDKESMTKILKFSYPLIPFSLIGYFSTNYLDAILISRYLSKADLGVYSIAYQINGILMQFPTAANTLLLPFFVSLHTIGDNAKAKLYMQEILPLLTFLGGIFSICTAYAVKIFVPVFFGQQAEGVVVIFWILISSAAFALPGLIGYAQYFNSLSVTYVATVMAIVAALANLIANLLLIPRYGLKGCAWATVLAYSLSLVTVTIIAKFRFSIKSNKIFPFILPVLIGSIHASLTEDFESSVLLAFASAFVIVLIYLKSFQQSVKLLTDYGRMLINRP